MVFSLKGWHESHGALVSWLVFRVLREHGFSVFSETRITEGIPFFRDESSLIWKFSSSATLSLEGCDCHGCLGFIWAVCIILALVKLRSFSLLFFSLFHLDCTL